MLRSCTEKKMLMVDYNNDSDSHSTNKRGHECLSLSTFVCYESRLLLGIPGNQELCVV